MLLLVLVRADCNQDHELKRKFRFQLRNLNTYKHNLHNFHFVCIYFRTRFTKIIYLNSKQFQSYLAPTD